MGGALEFWPKLALSVLATWRLSHLLAFEDGPWDSIARLRRRLGTGPLGRLMDCFYCLSLWVAAPVALWVGGSPVEWLVAWLAVSGGACLCERIGSGQAIVQPGAVEREGDGDGMLRPPSRGIAGQNAPGDGATDGNDADSTGTLRH